MVVTTGQFYLLCAGQGDGGLTELSVKLLKMIQTKQLLLGLVAGGAVSSSSGALKKSLALDKNTSHILYLEALLSRPPAPFS